MKGKKYLKKPSAKKQNKQHPLKKKRSTNTLLRKQAKYLANTLSRRSSFPVPYVSFEHVSVLLFSLLLDSLKTILKIPKG
jgi:hypothetical protein